MLWGMLPCTNATLSSSSLGSTVEVNGAMKVNIARVGKTTNMLRQRFAIQSASAPASRATIKLRLKVPVIEAIGFNGPCV